GAGRPAAGPLALLPARHLGDGEAARETQESGGGSAGAVLRRLLGAAVGLELVERRPYGGRVAPLGGAVHILGAAAPHDAIFAGADRRGAGVFPHIPQVLPAAPWVTLPHVR